MFTAAITAAVAAILSRFGIKPGPYLVGVAIAAKLLVIAIGVGGGAILMRRKKARAEKAAAAERAGGSLPGG